MKTFHYRWEWHFQSRPEALWPLVSDTNRFNRDVGVPEVERRGEGTHDNGRQNLKLMRFGVPIEWEEEPFEWVRPERFGVLRRYTRGPVAEMRTMGDLEARADGGTRLVYQVWATPRTLLGHAAIIVQIGILGARTFDSTFKQYDRMARFGAAAPLLLGANHLSPGGRQRLDTLRDRLIEGGAPVELVGRLAELVERGDDLTVARLRPYALADWWKLPRRQMLEVFLWATRAGLLDFRWDLLCPLCRGAKGSSTTLSEVGSTVHCDACHIDTAVNFDRLVELTFRPNAAIRSIDVGEYCVGSPQLTPHIVAQQLLGAGEERRVTLPLEAGRYRLRLADTPGAQLMVVADGGLLELLVSLDGVGSSVDEPVLSTRPCLTLRNTTEQERLVVLERTSWSDQSVTAAEVTRLQTFRDLFAREALRPGDQISVGTLTILFTDLRGSTQLYREIGDAIAFGRVMNHFDVLRASIRQEDGALIKTIGDAVMAAFPRPASAVRALIHAQRLLANPPEGMLPLVLKAGIHAGPCIAVTLNERLDYFGTAVNVAARAESQSHGGDVVVTDAVRTDPEVEAMIGHEVQAELFHADLKGFDERFRMWRLVPVPMEAPVAVS
jgi:class 3 adenylate cyclase